MSEATKERKELNPPSGSVLEVLEEEFTADCPKCKRLLHADKIHIDDPHCFFCGENLKIEISTPNA